MPTSEPLLSNVLWSLATVGVYLAARALNQRWNRWWTSPLILAPAILLAVALWLHTSYQVYIRGTHWLMLLLGPATVAFALPIYEQRALIRRHWPALLIGVAAGSSIAVGSAWALSSWLGLSEALRLSMVPRSISTPFAMAVSGDIGGMPSLTAVFVILTGIMGAAIGEGLLRCLPLRSSLARGALFGMGAHAAGVAKAHQIGGEEGSIAGLVLVMAGLLNVLLAPVLAVFLR
ncbi:MAG TPA: LrgB family protein [Stenomitos sp.]